MRRIGVIFSVVGVCIFCIPPVGEIYIEHKQEIIKELWTEEEVNQGVLPIKPQESVREIDEIEKVESIEDRPGKGSVIGEIEIPSIQVEMLLIEGVDRKCLKYGAGHIPDTAFPGQKGNCSIAGHRNYTFGTYFNRLDEVRIGDTINIYYGENIYSYKVYEILIVEPNAMEVLEEQGDKKTVTLITCHPIVVATHRLIVRGELVDITNA